MNKSKEGRQQNQYLEYRLTSDELNYMEQSDKDFKISKPVCSKRKCIFRLKCKNKKILNTQL